MRAASKEEFNSLTFWRNWYAGARHLPDDMRLAWYDAVLDFAFAGCDPQLPSQDDPLAAIRYQAVQMVRATIDISRKRKKIGSKGGAKPKQSRSKTEAKPNQEQGKGQVQGKGQEQYAISPTTAQPRGSSSASSAKDPPTLEQFQAGAVLAGVPADFAAQLYADLVAAEWRDSKGLYVANWRRYLKSAYQDAEKKSRAAQNSDSRFVDLEGIA
jgi:hypothetical protein